MKRCPICKEIFTDDLKFCRKDGALLDDVSIADGSARTLPLLKGGTRRLTDRSVSHDHRVCTATSDSYWLNRSGELQVCLAQPSPVATDDILKDKSRPNSLALAKVILEKEDGEAPLARWFKGQAGVVLFPEYAFSSFDFPILNDLINGVSTPIIVCAGFGLVRGEDLKVLLADCEPTWRKGSDVIDRLAHYNAGWCWIHEGPDNTRCFLFIKNYLDQRIEIGLSKNVTSGNSIFRLLSKDLVFYPLICADLISEEPDGPRVRIRNSLPTTEGHPDSNKRVMVATLMYTDQPYHELWHPAIDDIVKLHAGRGGLITVNQPYAEVQPDVKKDQWRCLSGGFINRAIMSKSPRPLLQPVRYVRTDSASGLVLRTSEVGVSCGSFRWVDLAAKGRYVWVPNVRRRWDGTTLIDSSDAAVLQELRRYVQRHKPKIVDMFHSSSKTLVQPTLDRIAAETEEKRVHPRLWSKLLIGIEEVPVTTDFDSMDDVSPFFDSALGSFAGVDEATHGEALVGERYHGQLLWNEREILVWNSPIHNTWKVYRMIQKSCLENAQERMLIVLGKGITGDQDPGRVLPDSRTDISTNRKSGSFTQPRSRHIFWYPLQKLENILNDPRTAAEEKRIAIRKVLSPN